MENWPESLTVSEPADEDPEVVPNKWIGPIKQEDSDNPFTKLMERFSNFYRVRRIVALVNRFVSNLRLKSKKLPIRHGFLTVSEIREAALVCVRIAQSESFQTEITSLLNGKTVKINSHLIKLTPFLDEHKVLRVGGRLDKGNFPTSLQHPIILPSNHALTRLVIIETHENLRHPSTERLLSDLRQRYWVVKGRPTINKFTSKCFKCRKLREIPVLPLMSSLPRHRLEPFQPPFTNCGLDYFGPYETTVGRRREKRYVLLFTCLVTRAVHLEVTHSMDTNSFIMAFQRFENRRGRPAVVYSDNGTQIVAGDKEIRSCLKNLNEEKIVGTLAKNNIEWKFSPPAAPHFGGVWESLVKSAKVALNSILDRRSLSDEMFSTIMVEVESLLNGRPLTHVSVDPSDPEPLTPNHFLLGRANPNIPIDKFDPTEISSRSSWRSVQVLINHFWQHWLKKYMPSLIERKKWLVQRRNIAVDDIVLIINPNTPRGHWPVGRVIQVMPGSDGVVRNVIIKTGTGEYVRPVAKLCLLEKDSVFDFQSKTPPAVSNSF